MNSWIVSSLVSNRMLANPSPVKQAPDNRSLNKATQLILESLKLETPPMAQIYLEPGVNKKLTHMRKPKTNYTLPSDMPELPLGFVPTNKTPGANGEMPPIVPVRESMPENLMTMFSKIEAANKETAQIEMVEKMVDKLDVGTMVSQQYLETKQIITEEKRYQSLIRHGFTEGEAEKAMGTIREQAAMKVALEAPKPEPVATIARAMLKNEPERTELKTEAIVKSEEPPIDVALDLKEKVKGRRGRTSDKVMAERLGITVDELKEGRRLERRTPREVAEFQLAGKGKSY